jgi:hypothetical protein
VFLFDMNRLFEDFVTRLTEHAFAGTDITVHAGPSRSILIDNDTGRPYRSIVPDLLLARGAGICGWRRVIDVNYKRYDRRGLQPTDIYQGILVRRHARTTRHPPRSTHDSPGPPRNTSPRQRPDTAHGRLPPARRGPDSVTVTETSAPGRA